MWNVDCCARCWRSLAEVLYWLLTAVPRLCGAARLRVAHRVSLPAYHFVPFLAWEAIPAVNGATVRQPSP